MNIHPALAAALGLVCFGCSGEDGSPRDPGLAAQGGTAGLAAAGGSDPGAGSAGGGTSGGGRAGATGSGGSLSIPVAGTGGSAGSPSGEVCATETATAELEPVYLAFAFDVSG